MGFSELGRFELLQPDEDKHFGIFKSPGRHQVRMYVFKINQNDLSLHSRCFSQNLKRLPIRQAITRKIPAINGQYEVGF